MTVLVTGATGFLGRRVLSRLAKMGEVVSLVRDADGVADALRLPNVRHVSADLSGKLGTEMLPESVDAVVHMAQSPHYRNFPDGASDVFDVNVAATMRLADYARRAGARAFVYTSSGSICSSAVGGATAEDAAAFPADLYSASKLAAETLLRPYEAVMSVASLRLFGLYGPGLTEKLVHLLWTRVCSGEPITLTGSSDGLVMPLTHVDDCAECVLAAMNGGWSGVYNVAPRELISIRRMAEVLGEAAGKAPVLDQHEGAPPPRIQPDLAKLARVYDLDALRAPEQGLRQVYGMASTVS